MRENPWLVSGFHFLQTPKIVVSKEKLVIGGISILIYFILEYSFVNILSTNYNEFLRFKVGETPALVRIISYGLPLLLTLLLISLPASEFIYSILCLLLVLTIYPSTILLRHLNTDPLVVSLNVFYFFSLYGFSRIFTKKIFVLPLKESQKTPLLLSLSVLCIAPFVITFGPHIDFKNLILYNIYESRLLETQLSNQYMGYVYSSLTNVILPLLLVIAILHKEYLKSVAAFAMLIFMFLVGGHKSVFFATFLMIYFYYGSYERKIKYFLLGVSIILSAVIISYYQNHDLFLFSLFTRRIFFVPAILDIGYFDFFDGIPIFWSDSILRSFIEYPFTMQPRNLIGQHVLLYSYTNANSGIISDGFMNFGIPGSILNIFFVSTIFAMLNTLNLSHRFFGLIFLLFFTFLSTYFFTTMITHGGLLFMVLAHLFLKNSRSTYND